MESCFRYAPPFLKAVKTTPQIKGLHNPPLFPVLLLEGSNLSGARGKQWVKEFVHLAPSSPFLGASSRAQLGAHSSSPWVPEGQSPGLLPLSIINSLNRPPGPSHLYTLAFFCLSPTSWPLWESPVNFVSRTSSTWNTLLQPST